MLTNGQVHDLYGQEAGSAEKVRFAIARRFGSEVADYVRPRVKDIYKPFGFGKKAVAVKNCRNKHLADRKITRLRIERKRSSRRVLQHMLRFQERYAKFFPAFRRRMPEIAQKYDPAAFGNVMNGECAAIGLESINSIGIALKRHAQALPEHLYKIETVHFQTFRFFLSIPHPCTRKRKWTSASRTSRLGLFTSCAYASS